MDIFLRFPNEAASSILKNGEDFKYVNTVVLGTLPDDPEWHVNIRLNGSVPDDLVPFQVHPVTPYCQWA